jgi:hypothetical protein
VLQIGGTMKYRKWKRRIKGMKKTPKGRETITWRPSTEAWQALEIAQRLGVISDRKSRNLLISESVIAMCANEKRLKEIASMASNKMFRHQHSVALNMVLDILKDMQRRKDNR